MKRTKNITTEIECTSFNKDVFNQTGVFVWKQGIPEKVILDLQNQWKLYYSKILEKTFTLFRKNFSSSDFFIK